MQIGIVAPSAGFTQDGADRVTALVAAHYPDLVLEWHPQCFASAGHFAGDDSTRCAALVDMANRTDIDAIWFARGGYGACRIAEDALAQFRSAATDKLWMGYSDQGNLLGALYRNHVGRQVHGPMPADIMRDGGDAAVLRAARWFATEDPAVMEKGLKPGARHVAFNLMTLSMMLGTPLEPDLSGHILLIEEVSEHFYAVDRAAFHVTEYLANRGLAGLRLGRVSAVPENDRPFGADEETIVRHWCARASIPYLGRADIGHDADNKIVPFGKL